MNNIPKKLATARAALPPERIGHAPPPALAERRSGMATAVAAGVWVTDPPAQTDTLGGVRVLRFQPPGEARGVILHLHGGAYRIGCPEMEGTFATALAARCGVDVVCPAYRLAPEHPFPSGLNDALAVLEALRKESDLPFILSGESAGGGLAASLASVCGGTPLAPQALVLLSAWLDLTVSNPIYETNAATDPLFSRASAEEAAQLYLQGLTPEHPVASALLGSVAAFPPTFVSIGEGEVLAEDGRQFHEALLAAGVPSTFVPIAGMEHVAVTRGFELVGAQETFAALASFIDLALDRADPSG